MAHLDDLIEEFDGEEGMFHIGPETQVEIKKLRKLVVELEEEIEDERRGYNKVERYW